MLLAPSAGAAQACHGARDVTPSGNGVGVRLSSVLGGYDVGASSGDYVGVAVGAWARARPVEGDATITGYLLQDSARDVWGLGDAVLAVRGRLLADPMPLDLAIGARLSVPTGSSTNGIGMGHFMAGPELRASHAWTRVELSSSIVYMRALSQPSAHAHHHHDAGPTPRVDPHGRSELSWLASLGVRLAHAWLVRAVGLLAVPVDDPQGALRLVVGPGVSWTQGRASVSMDLETPLVASPFVVRVTISVGVLLL